MAYKGGLRKWFSENWVDISAPKKGGGFEYGSNVKETGSPSFAQEMMRGGKSRDAQIAGTIERTGKSMSPMVERGVDQLSKYLKGRFG